MTQVVESYVSVREGEVLPLPLHIYAKNANGAVTNYTELAGATVKIHRREIVNNVPGAWEPAIVAVAVDPGDGSTWAKVTDTALGIVTLYPNAAYWGVKGKSYGLLVEVVPVAGYIQYAPTDTEIIVTVTADNPS